jgi:hypothetical protein
MLAALLVVLANLAPILLAGADTTVTPSRPAPPVSCDEDPAFHRLDFWLGNWEVFEGDTLVGTNRIEKLLDGCAILENWTDTSGGQGKSLFYYQRATATWKQVWVTDQAGRPGGLKEKKLIETLSDGGLRFQGEIPLAKGGHYLDRTTLTPLPGGLVRQVIEISKDDGRNWDKGFDAIYRKSPRPK